MNAAQILAQAPLGAVVQYANGEPKPPARFTRKLAAWEAENGTGQLAEKRPGARPQFTLRSGSHAPNGVKIIEFFRTFSNMDPLHFTITEIPVPGSFLIVRHRHTSQTEELLHVAESRAAAEHWLAKHPDPDAIIQPAA